MSSAEQQSISASAWTSTTIRISPRATGRSTRSSASRVGSDVVADKPPERVEAIIIDCSTSMQSPSGKFDEAKRATEAAIEEMVDGTYFAIIAGTEKAASVYPDDGRPTRASAVDQGSGRARRRRPAAQRRDRDRYLARARPRTSPDSIPGR